MNRKFVAVALSGLGLVALIVIFFISSQRREAPVTQKDKGAPLRRLPTSVDPQSRATTDRARMALKIVTNFHSNSVIARLDFKEKILVNIGRDYELSLEYRATSYGRFRSALGERVSVINGFVIYRPKDGNLSPEMARSFEDDSFPVVKGVNNSMLGLLTGRLIVKSMDPTFDVVAELGAKVLYKSPELGLTYVKIPEGTDLISFYESLAGFEQINRADLEILQGGVSTR